MPLLTWEPTLQPMRTSSLRTLPLQDASVPSTPPPPLPPSPAQHGIVTLGQVRFGPRTLNDYVDSPRSQPPAPLKPPPPPLPAHLGLGGLSCPLPHVPSTNGTGVVSLPCRTNHTTLGGGGGGVGGGGHVTSIGVGGGSGGGGGVVSTQPSKCPPPPPLKENAGADSGGGGGNAGGGGGGGDRHSSIMCSRCGKCRCGACSERRELPVRWCCGERYELSAHKAVDWCTCFCCVQTVFYHCGGEEEDNQCYDNPCSCSPGGGGKCCSRWACLALSALLLPCLWCYWPLRGGLAASKACYNNCCCCRKKGCQCSRQTPTGDKTPPSSFASQTRRLLVESESSSSSA